MISFVVIQHLGIYAFKRTFHDPELVALLGQLRVAFPAIIDHFLDNKFASMRNKFISGELEIPSQVVNTVFNLFEFVGPRQSVLNAIRICLNEVKYPAVSASTAMIMLTLLSSLKLLPSDAWTRFSDSKGVKLTSTTFYLTLNGTVRSDLLALYHSVEPQLMQLSPKAPEVAAYLRSLVLDIPDIRNVEL